MSNKLNNVCFRLCPREPCCSVVGPADMAVRSLGFVADSFNPERQMNEAVQVGVDMKPVTTHLEP